MTAYRARLYRLILGAAAAYNVAFGLWAALFPLSFFDLFALPPPRYPAIWACLGMVVGLYGLVYALAARHLERAAPLVAIGLLGKLLGPIGWVATVAQGEWPLRTVTLLVFNDLIWWLPFGLFLLERPVRVLRAGQLVTAPAFSAARDVELPAPVGRVSSRLGESPDVVTLPESWPTLREVDFRIATRRRLLDHLLALTARHPALLAALRAAMPVGRRLTRWLGPRSGGFAVEVEAAGGGVHRAGFVHDRHSYLVAVAPAVLAARALAAGTFPETGLVPAARQVDPQRLRELLARHGVRYFADPPR